MHGRAWSSAACAALWAGLVWPAAAAAQTAPQQAPANHIAWQTLARSVENRVIEYCRFGEGNEHVLVVASLAGDEYEGVELAERLASHLEQFPRRLQDTTVTIVRDPNPDGRFRRTATNARGVLIDQNFRTRHWRKSPHGDRWLSGKEPESEPETRALADLFDDLKPTRVIVLGSTRRPGVLNYAGPGEQNAREVAEAARMRPLALNSADAAGALAAFAGFDRGIPTIVFRVPARSPVETNWSNYKRALLAAIDAASESASDAAKAAPDAQTSGADSQSLSLPLLDPQEPRRLGAPTLPVALQSPGKAEAETPARTEGQGVLSAKQFQNGITLVPVVPPPSRPTTVKRPPNIKLQPGKPPASPVAPSKPPAAAIKPASPGASAAGSVFFGPSPGVGGWRPKASSVAPSSLTTQTPSAEPAPRLERFPPVDTRKRPTRDLRQEPIPFYPRTGF